MKVIGRFRRLAGQIDAATPASRDRAVDALRALAITGVILGHWMVTALVASHGGHAIRDESPLAALPVLTPVSWIFQTLAIFFLVGGYAAARSYRGGYRAWLCKRLERLSRPVAVLAALWAIAGSALYASGVSGPTLRALLTLILDPLWFLGVFAVLTAATPLAAALVRRFGAWAALLPLGVVAGVDLVRFGFGAMAWLGWINVLAGWLVPYVLGIAWAKGAFRNWKTPALMLTGGVAATVALVHWAGYPASMVGVNGAPISNLNPPTLAVVAFGTAQVGLALLLRPLLARWMRHPVAWAMVATANLSAMTLFLWHQTAFIAVTMTGLLIGRPPGLLTAPTNLSWVVERLAWLPLFAIVLAVLWAAFRRTERPLGAMQNAVKPNSDVPKRREHRDDQQISDGQWPGVEQVAQERHVQRRELKAERAGHGDDQGRVGERAWPGPRPGRHRELGRAEGEERHALPGPAGRVGP
jgi:fucose 4-O-acetylase-like acetyltransferase